MLREKGVTNFESVWGVSAGAINAVSFRSKQMGRAMRIMLAFRDDPRFLSLRSLITTGDIAGADFMFDEIQNHLDPCDNEAFNQNPMQMYAVASDVTFGTPAYLHVKKFPEDVTMSERPRRCQQFLAWLSWMDIVIWTAELPIQFLLRRRLACPTEKQSVRLTYLTIRQQRKRWSLSRRTGTS